LPRRDWRIPERSVAHLLSPRGQPHGVGGHPAGVTALVEGPSSQTTEGLTVTLCGLFHDVVWKFRWCGIACLIPSRSLGSQPVTHELFIKRVLRAPGFMSFCIPEAGRVWGQHFVP